MQNALIQAIRDKNCKQVTSILRKHPAMINELLPDGKAPIHLAVESKNLQLVQAITSLKTINLNIRTKMPATISDGMTPVFMASYLANDDSILEHLIQQGADTSLATTNGQTPLTVAAYSNFTSRVRLIIKTNNANVNSIVNGGYTALINAVEKSDSATVRSILAIPGMSIINHKRDNGESALFIAVRLGDMAKVAALLEVSEIDITAICSDGKSAFQLATEKADKKIVNLFKLRATGPFPSYSQFLITQRVLHSSKMYSQYLIELNDLLLYMPHSKVPESEEISVKARKLWSDIVSDIDRVNTGQKNQVNYDEKIINRLKSLGYIPVIFQTTSFVQKKGSYYVS